MAEHRKTKGHLSPKKVRRGHSLSPGKMPLIGCGFETCDFATKYASNLARHRRRTGHFLSEADKLEAAKEAERDQLAKTIEATKEEPLSDVEDHEDGDSVEDLTIPLAKKYSPSKITDFFKPIITPKKSDSEIENVKKTLDMDSLVPVQPDKSKQQKQTPPPEGATKEKSPATLTTTVLEQ